MTSATARRVAVCNLSRREAAGLAIVLAAAVVLRVVGLRAGLPGAALLSADENTVVPKTLAMIHDGTANPHWFLYPSLYLGLLAVTLIVIHPLIDTPHGLGFASPDAYALDPTPYILTGRVLSLVAGVALVIAVWLLGRRVGGGAVGAMAAALMAVAPMTVAYSHVAVTDMTMTALLTFGLWQLVVAAQDRSRRALLVAAALIGLAASAKYNAGVAVLPLMGVAWWLAAGAHMRRLAASLRAGGVTFGAFVLGTPFALLDAPHFIRDFARQNRIVADGWLGFEHTSPGPWYNLREVLWSGTGAGLVALSVIGLGLALVRRTRADWVLAPYALVFFVYVSTWNAHFDRYLLPIVPVLAVLASRAAVELVAHVAARGRVAGVAGATAGVVVLLGHPLVTTISLVRGYGTRDLRLDAAATISRLIAPGSSVATDPLGPPLLTRDEGARLVVAGIQRPSYALIRFATPQPGQPTDPNRSVAGLRRQRVRWVITSGDIERRVMRARERYPAETRFYEDIRSQAKLALQVPPGPGPGATLWDLGDVHSG